MLLLGSQWIGMIDVWKYKRKIDTITGTYQDQVKIWGMPSMPAYTIIEYPIILTWIDSSHIVDK